jgi:hypothetical protein
MMRMDICKIETKTKQTRNSEIKLEGRSTIVIDMQAQLLSS